MIIKKIMNLIKKTLLIFCVILISFFTIISLTEFLLKSQFGLGKPLVYESHNLWGYSPAREKILNILDLKRNLRLQ